MKTLSNLKKHCADMSAQHPELKSRIWGYYYLAESEISEGDCEAIEVGKAISDIADEIEEYLQEEKQKETPKRKYYLPYRIRVIDTAQNNYTDAEEGWYCLHAIEEQTILKAFSEKYAHKFSNIIWLKPYEFIANDGNIKVILRAQHLFRK